MKKIVKIALWSLAGILALIVLAVATTPLWVGPTAGSVARSLVPSLTGCEFKLDKIALNPFTGKFDLSEAHLSNPKGYDAPEAFGVGLVHVDVDVGSLFSNTIHVRDITIEKPFVSYVFDDAGSNNFERILAQVESKLGLSGKEEEKKEEEKKEEAKAGKKLVIDRLCISGTKVRYRMITLPIPLPTLTNIGKESGGATPEEVCETVWDKMKGSFSAIGTGLGSAASALGEGATNALKGAANLLGADGAADAAAKAAESATKAVGDTAKDATKALGDGAKAVGDGAKDAVKKLGGLLGK